VRVAGVLAVEPVHDPLYALDGDACLPGDRLRIDGRITRLCIADYDLKLYVADHSATPK
jgi:hypothetical protein